MDFTLSKQQQMVQKMYKEFAENEVKPLAKKVDAEEYFPKETVEKMAKLGMMGIYFPKSVGGAGGDVLSPLWLSRSCPRSAAPPVSSCLPTPLCAQLPSMRTAPPSRRPSICPSCAAVRWIGAFGLTEPVA